MLPSSVLQIHSTYRLKRLHLCPFVDLESTVSFLNASSLVWTCTLKPRLERKRDRKREGERETEKEWAGVR